MIKILDFVKIAVTDTTNESLEFSIGNVSNHLGQRISSELGIPSLAGAKRTLMSHAVRHAFVRHQSKKSEEERGQIGIVEKDFEFLTDILSNPTAVTKGDLQNRKRQIVIKFSKNIKGRLYCVLMSVNYSKSGPELFFNTMFIKK